MVFKIWKQLTGSMVNVKNISKYNNALVQIELIIYDKESSLYIDTKRLDICGMVRSVDVSDPQQPKIQFEYRPSGKKRSINLDLINRMRLVGEVRYQNNSSI